MRMYLSSTLQCLTSIGTLILALFLMHLEMLQWELHHVRLRASINIISYSTCTG